MIGENELNDAMTASGMNMLDKNLDLDLIMAEHGIDANALKDCATEWFQGDVNQAAAFCTGVQITCMLFEIKAPAS
jgi:hypothetical protein